MVVVISMVRCRFEIFSAKSVLIVRKGTGPRGVLQFDGDLQDRLQGLTFLSFFFFFSFPASSLRLRKNGKPRKRVPRLPDLHCPTVKDFGREEERRERGVVMFEIDGVIAIQRSRSR